MLKVTVSKLLEKIRRKIFNQPDNSKELKRVAINSGRDTSWNMPDYNDPTKTEK